jgi:hypothetical protein
MHIYICILLFLFVFCLFYQYAYNQNIQRGESREKWLLDNDLGQDNRRVRAEKIQVREMTRKKYLKDHLQS